LKRALDAQTSGGLSDGATDDPYDVGEGLAQCQRSCDGMNRSLKAISDRHGDATDAHSAMQRALREVATAYGSGGQAQVSGGLANGQSEARARRQRHLQYLELASVDHQSEEYKRRQRHLEYMELAAKAY
jgi:hypothetical protein